MKNDGKILLNKVIEYYSQENLTRISQKIIEAYKSKKYSYLINIGNHIDNSIVKNSTNVQKLFSQLIMLYHPDRANFYKEKLKNASNVDEYIHIITISENLDKFQIAVEQDSSNYDIEFEYGYDEEDFDSVINEHDDDDYGEYAGNNKFEFDFISLMKYRELGNIEDELPSFYFEELEGALILCDSNLFDIWGLEKCIYIEELDLANNQIMDITPVGYLKQLTDINLSANNIHTVEVLKNLSNLKRIDISFNEIDNIEPLMELKKLEFLNIIGNNIPEIQIEKLKNKKMVFVY